MTPGNFQYHAPADIGQALALLQQHGDAAKLLAGGHSLLPMMKLRFASPEHLIDLKNVAELKGVREESGEIRIGAMTSESELIASPLLREKCPLISEVAQWVADPQVRNCGTIGGDIAHGDPGNDQPAAMLAAEASFVVKGPRGERVLAADGFFLGTYANQLEPDEILTEIRVPAVNAGTGYAYCKLNRKVGDFATAAAAVQLELAGGVCRKIAIALTNAAPTAVRVKAAEALLAGKAIDDSLIEQAAQAAMAVCDPAEDLRGNREYKTHMAGEMTRRAIRLALQRAKGN